MATRRERALFDRIFRQVLHTLPAAARAQLQTIPIAVDDFPAPDLRVELDAGSEDLFGLYTGTPPIVRSIEHAGELEDVIHVYRLALLRDARTSSGRINQRRLRAQIRTTLLHELGHYHGFDEDDLERLGYS
jgi:predicted Zn-dependent protease with MMP-like domain